VPIAETPPAADAYEVQSTSPLPPTDPGASQSNLLVTELLTSFWDHAQTYYRRPDGTPTPEVDCYRQALRPVYEVCGETPVATFGPRCLMLVRDAMIKRGWCRTTTNRQLTRVRSVFRWGVEQELVPAPVYHGLLAVKGLRAGRSEAVEPDAVEPVAMDLVDKTLPHLSPMVQTMVKIQLHTGCRAGELVQMRACDLTRSDPIWVYRPRQHKTQHHGLKRLIYLDKECQDLLAERLRANENACIFSPAVAEQERRAALSAARKTPSNQGNRPGYSAASREGAHPRRAPGDVYTVDTYRRAIARACDAAFPLPKELKESHKKLSAWRKAYTVAHGEAPKFAQTPEELRKAHALIESFRTQHRWHPHQLRHMAATLFRQKYGLEVARVLLGHQDTKMTRHYSRPDHEAALRQLAGQASAAA
jgi:integrase